MIPPNSADPVDFDPRPTRPERPWYDRLPRQRVYWHPAEDYAWRHWTAGKAVPYYGETWIDPYQAIPTQRRIGSW